MKSIQLHLILIVLALTFSASLLGCTSSPVTVVDGSVTRDVVSDATMTDLGPPCSGRVCNQVCVDDQSDPENCGACGRNCLQLPHVVTDSATCVAGACVLASMSCEVGFADCDHDLTNGCEANLADPTSCGACGVVCSNRNGTPSCSMGTCLIACTAPWGDCDHDPGNGCEIDLTTFHDCGRCGNSCPIGGSCQAGTCSMTCPTDFADCDGRGANGCEADLSTDASNCGSCGNTCSNGTCEGGHCCTPRGNTCQGIPCCGGLACGGDFPGSCGGSTHTCAAPGLGCTNNADCCSGTCRSRACCGNTRDSCGGTEFCCDTVNQICYFNQCCKIFGVRCSTDDECCTRHCRSGACAA